MADSDILITALTVTAGVGVLTASWTMAPPASPLPYLQLDHFEVWVSTVDDIGTATKVADSFDLKYAMTGHFVVTRYFWVRAVDLSANLGAFYPTGSGISSNDLSLSIELDMLGQELQNTHELVNASDAYGLQAQISALQERADDDALAFMDALSTLRERISILSVQKDGAVAGVIRNEQAVIDEQGARSSLTEQVFAAMGDALASGTLSIDEVVDAISSTSTITFNVKAKRGQLDAFATAILSAFLNGDGSAGGLFGVVGGLAIYKTKVSKPTILFSVDADDGEVHVKTLTFDEAIKSAKTSSGTPLIYFDGQGGFWSLGGAV